MAELLTPDICVIGAGAGGLSVAVAAATLKVPVVLVENARMGGDCLNSGCVPSKALLAAGKRAETIRRAMRFGLGPASPAVDFARVHGHVEGVIATLAPNDSVARLAGLGVRVIAGTGRFVDPDTVVVGDDIKIRARRVVIATGSMPALPAIAGLEQVPYLTNETVFGLTECPAHLIVIGAGPGGLELAQAHRRLGAEVTVLEAAVPLSQQDPECAAIVLDQLRREGIVLQDGVTVESVDHRSNIRIRIAGPRGMQIIEGSHVLIAVGRRPRVEALDLKAAVIALGPNGIAVDKRLRTTNRRVYAIGDVIGAPQFTHVSNYHAGLVIRNALFRLPIDRYAGVIPAVMYTDPELAQVGLTADQASAQRRSIRILRWRYDDNDRAQAERDSCGHIKVVTSRHGRILGATVVGAQAGELITAWTLAIAQNLNIRALAELVVPYPTLSEVGKRAAMTYFMPNLTNPWVQRIIGVLRRLG
jgi:pyruvate/2-oxoglutarate dehydrogenase complex dihydrolipoamide dehydrogenase (E3) component